MMICSHFLQVWVSNKNININDMLCNLLLRICFEPWVREPATFKRMNEALSFPTQNTCPSICGEEQRRKLIPTQPAVPYNEFWERYHSQLILSTLIQIKDFITTYFTFFLAYVKSCG